MSTQSSPQRGPTLDYHRPRRFVDSIVSRLGAAHLAIAIAVAGYSVAWIYSRITPGYWVENISVLAWLGVGGFAAGTLGYVVLRIGSRRELNWLHRVQLFLATLVGVIGALAVVQRLDEARESFLNPEFWLTYNPTYRYNRYWVLRPLRITAFGIAWFVVVLVIARFRRVTPCPLPPEAE